MHTWPNGSGNIPPVTDEWGMRVNPVSGVYTLHEGIDLVGFAYNLASAGGVVTFASYNGGAGNEVRVAHDDGTETRYKHNRAFMVVVGQRVERGQGLGIMGTTGNSTGVHCHFETRNSSGSASRNPRGFMADHRTGSSGLNVRSLDDQRSKSMATLYFFPKEPVAGNPIWGLAGDGVGPAAWINCRSGDRANAYALVHGSRVDIASWEEWERLRDGYLNGAQPVFN